MRFCSFGYVTWSLKCSFNTEWVSILRKRHCFSLRESTYRIALMFKKLVTLHLMDVKRLSHIWMRYWQKHLCIQWKMNTFRMTLSLSSHSINIVCNRRFLEGEDQRTEQKQKSTENRIFRFSWFSDISIVFRLWNSNHFFSE